MSGRCDACGLEIEGGARACRELFETLCARDYTEAPTHAVHRVMVDACALPHPDEYGISAKSFAAHLAGLCCAFEHAGEPALMRALRGWLDGRVDPGRPVPPAARGAVRIDAAARATWDAYADLQPLARQWVEAARTASRRARR